MRKLLTPLLTLALVTVLWLEPLFSGHRQTPPVRAALPATKPVERVVAAPASQPAATAAITLVHPPKPPNRTVTSVKLASAKLTPSPRPLAKPNVPPPPISALSASSVNWTTLRGSPKFWRLGQTADGVWWFISPDGRAEFMNTVTTVQPFQVGRDPRGTFFVSRDYNGTPTTPGDLKLWAQRTVDRVRAYGFKGIGAWSHPVFHSLAVPITRDLNIWANVPAEHQRLYDPQWLPIAAKTVEAATVPLRENGNLVGYFLDNELDLSDAAVGPRIYFDNLPAGDPNRAEVLKVIRKLWPEAADFDQAWGLSLENYQAIEQLTMLPKDPPEVYARLQSAWLEHLMTDYFRRACELVHKYDPNHLILGIRFAGHAEMEVARASRGFCDAESLNYYVSDALLDPQLFKSLYEASNQPLIISEYAFHSLDNRSGNRNTAGFSAQVPDQQARADGYRLMTQRFAQTPWIIGADWFQWADEPPSGRNADGEDVNFGIVDVDDREYTQLTDAIRALGPRLNDIHYHSPTLASADRWRDDFSNLPTQHVPYLVTPIRINGELSDWPSSARLPRIQLTQTIGMERANVPPPNVYLGWREEGLYLGLEVFDPTPTTAPLTGKWWTRDMAEFWLSTRPVPNDLTGYNKYCHQFLFLPSDPSGNNGIAGAVGQWHRPGDSLYDNLLPHPEMLYNCRLLRDRYVVEIFIPGTWLHGWDPQNQSTMAFNIHVKDYQRAADYFWSAPKELQTQLRPRTWGAIHLDAPPTSADHYGPIDPHNNVLSLNLPSDSAPRTLTR